jgi:DNA-directed RNA polymerase specialized sigma24 family protein
MTDPDSGNELARRVAQGTESAKEEVYRRYHGGLVAFVQRELGGRRARCSAESIAMSAWGSFLRGVAGQRYRFDHAGALWRLLTTIARHKIYDAARDRKDANVDLEADRLAGQEPTPADAAAVADTIEKVLDGRPPLYGDVLQLLLGGCSVAEIARRLKRGRQQVRTVQKYLRERLERLQTKTDDG